ncbi:MAG: ABC transporter permease [Candidatus Margulisiibacteriota bacterium]
MRRYIVKRLISLIPLLLGVSLVSFLIMHLAPGDPTAMLTDPSVKPEELLRLRQNWGLDRPLIVQYFYWLWHAIRFDFGTAYMLNRPVSAVIAERLPATLLLMGTSFAVTLLIAVPLGVLSAAKKKGWFDNLVTVISFAGMSIPSFWLALMLMLLFSVKLNLLPAGGMYDPSLQTPSFLKSAIDVALHMALPVATMVIVALAGITRYVRSSMLEALSQNYIKAARARGLFERTVIFKHALRNALLPLITLIGLSLPELFGGAFIVETIFAWPGMGRLGVAAVFSRNYPVIMGVVMFSAFLIVIGNLLADVCYALADPRIRYEKVQKK